MAPTPLSILGVELKEQSHHIKASEDLYLKTIYAKGVETLWIDDTPNGFSERGLL